LTYEAASAYLLGTINETASRRQPGRLDRMRRFLAELGDPHVRYPTLHVGGTSGKGSTATMLAAVLTASGRRTALHTKPHLASMTERARVDGIPIEPDAFGALLEEMMPAIERTAQSEGRPSYYETLLALSYLHFARAGVDVAVIEVGVGGTLDGTNLLQPLVSVITNVGLDHTDILGTTHAEIARDKAGIAKPGVPLISDAREPVARAVIEERCLAVGAPFFAVEEHAQIERRRGQRYGQAFDVVTERARYSLELPVVGPFQRRNAATAIVALERMLPLPGDPPVAATIVDGFAQLVIPGRMECFPARPAVVFDIAHNPDKAQSLADALREEFPGRRLTFVIAIGDGKDAVAVLERLFPLPAGFVFTTFETAGRRAVRPQRLASVAQSRGHWARTVVDPVEALSVARRSTDSDGIVVVTGSTFLVATLRDWWLSNVGAPTRR
jgi:dihydrofolate synthase/folylpolyglutamate synthase